MEEYINKENVRKERIIMLILVLALSIAFNIVGCLTIEMNLENIDKYKAKLTTTETRAVELEAELERMTTQNKELQSNVERLERQLAEQPK